MSVISALERAETACAISAVSVEAVGLECVTIPNRRSETYLAPDNAGRAGASECLKKGDRTSRFKGPVPFLGTLTRIEVGCWSQETSAASAVGDRLWLATERC